MGVNEASEGLIIALDIIVIICQLVLAIIGVYYLIFAKKVAEKQKAKPNSRNADLDIKILTKRIRLSGILSILLAALLFLM